MSNLLIKSCPCPTSDRDKYSFNKYRLNTAELEVKHNFHMEIFSDIGDMQLRKVARELSYRRRGVEALNSNEQVQLRHLSQMILVLSVKLFAMNRKKCDLKKMLRVKKLLLCTSMIYISIAGETFDNLQTLPSFNRTIASFPIEDCKPFFRFTRQQLYILLDVLRNPAVIQLRGGNVLSGEEVLLRGLYELVSGENQYRIAANVFGVDQPLQSKAWTAFIMYVYVTFGSLLTDRLPWFYKNGHLHRSAEAIQKKMDCTSGFNPPAEFKNKVACFIDCNCLSTSVVGGGPSEGGANAHRWHESIQRAFYNGWKSVHGLKHQTVDCAYGLTIHMYGPTSLR